MSIYQERPFFTRSPIGIAVVGAVHQHWLGKGRIHSIDEENGVECFDSVDDTTQIVFRFSDVLRQQAWSPLCRRSLAKLAGRTSAAMVLPVAADVENSARMPSAL